MDSTDLTITDGIECISQVTKKKLNENTFADYVKSKKQQIDKETLELRMESHIQNNILEKDLLTWQTLILLKKKCQMYFANPVMHYPKNIRVGYCKHNEYEPCNNAIEALSVEVTALKLLNKGKLK